MKPPPLLPGDTIGVMAPSSYVSQADIERSAARLAGLGYKIFIHPQTYARQHQSAGTAAEKIAALTDLLKDPAVKAIWAAGGGNRALHLLEDLPYPLFRKHPKILIGFSDTTALLNAVYAKTGLITFHGPVFRQLADYEPLAQALETLRGAGAPIPLAGATILRPGTARGRLIGGCLSIFQYLPGTDFMPKAKGAILFLEDTGDHVSRFDRMLLHLRRMKVFQNISALVVGEFTDLQEGSRPFGFSLRELVEEHLEHIDIPVVLDAPFGHGKNLPVFPVGAEVELCTSKGYIILRNNLVF